MDKQYLREVTSRFVQSYWNLISTTPGLSIEVMRKHQDKLNWRSIAICQIITPEIRKDFGHHLDKINK
jgi:hypothetical protein